MGQQTNFIHPQRTLFLIEFSMAVKIIVLTVLTIIQVLTKLCVFLMTCMGSAWAIIQMVGHSLLLYFSLRI